MAFTAPKDELMKSGEFVAPEEELMAPTKKTPASWSDVPQNLVNDVNDFNSGIVAMGKKIYSLPREAIESGWSVLKGTPFSETSLGQTASDVNNTVQTALPHFEKDSRGVNLRPGVILDSFGHEIAHPIESFKEHPLNVAMDAASVIDPAIEGVRAGWGKVVPLAEKAGTKGISAALGPKSGATEARLANPDIIKNALPSDALAERLPQSVKTLQDQISLHDADAWKALRKSADPKQGAIPKEDVLQMIKNIRDGLEVEAGGLVGQAAKKADTTLSAIESDIKGVGGRPTPPSQELNSLLLPHMGSPGATHIPETSVKDIIHDIDMNTDWDKPGLEEVNNSLKNFRNSLDTRLKENNVKYAEMMEPVAKRVDLIETLKNKFNLIKKVGQDMLLPGNSTATNLETALKEKSLASRSALEKLKELTGEDYLVDLQNAAHAKEFKGGVTQGSRRTTPLTGIGGTVGGAVGHAVAGTPGAVVGGAAGMTAGFLTGLVLDVNGRKLAGDVIDFYAKHRPQALGKYAPILSDSIRKGAQAFAITHRALMNDPDYRKTLTELIPKSDGSARFKQSTENEGFAKVR